MQSKPSPEVFIVIPTVRNLEFLHDWAEQFCDATVIICEDHPTKELKTPHIGKKVYHYAWKDIDKELAKNGWIIPRKVSAIRNFGFLKAYQLGADVIMTLDDDCYPVPGHHFVQDHLRNLNLTAPKRWINTYPHTDHLFTRGQPYLTRQEQPVMLSHGLWTNVLDHDAATHLQHLSFKAELAEQFVYFIPSGAYFPLCSMNIAFKRELTPLLYFPLMGQDVQGNSWGYDRFDDIWAGIFAKKIMDHLGLGVVNGSPFVEHRKASDPFKNLQKEAKGLELNETVWKAVDAISLTKKNATECYLELASKLELEDKKYGKKLTEAMQIWASFF
jgi:reversibly glycosylated polypeptide / UDP-arabinopyranose mutase